MAGIQCAICLLNFNKTVRSQITCEYGDCNYSEACKTCVRTYIKSSTLDPHCMNCRKLWTRKFMIKVLNRSFVISELKTHRQNLLLEREISKLPETSEAAARAAQIQASESKIGEAFISRKIIADKKYGCLQALKQFPRNSKDRKYYQDLRKVLKEEYDLAQKHLEILQENHNALINLPVKVLRNNFIMPCSSNNCKGYLTTQYKCNLCDKFTCVKCHVYIDSEKNLHECKKEDVETVTEVKKNSKPCPNCAARISKIEGCDQMWCISCHVAFSWNTGKIETGRVHNPHFYEYQRNTNGGVAPRVAGDDPCGGYPNLVVAVDYIKHYREKYPSIEKFYILVQHIRETLLLPTQTTITQLMDNETIRVDYILDRITRPQMAKKVYQNDVRRQEYVELVHIYELIVNISADLYRNFIGEKITSKTVEKFHDEIIALTNYCNAQIVEIYNTYRHVTPYIDQIRWLIVDYKAKN